MATPGVVRGLVAAVVRLGTIADEAMEAWHREALDWEGKARDYGERLREMGQAERGEFEMIVCAVEPGSRHPTPFGGEVFSCPEIRASLQPLDGMALGDFNHALCILMDKRVKVAFEVMVD